MELHPVKLSHLDYIEAGQFIQRLMKDTTELSLDLKKDRNIAGYMENLAPAFKQFNLALQQLQGQKETLEILTLDLVRDRCLTTLKRQISVFQYDEEQDIMEAYAAAMRIVKNYKGIEALNYEAESLAIQNLLTEWAKAENKNYKNTLKLEDRLMRLQQASDNFDKKFGERSVTVTIKEVYDAKVLRNDMLAIYRSLAEYTLVMAKQKNADPLYPALLDSLNNIRKYFADMLARREK